MATEVDIPLIPGLRHVGPAPKVSTAPASPIEGLRYVGEVPTVGGFAREAGKEIAKAGTKAAVASPLKGLGALQYSNQVQANKTLLYPMMRDVAAKLKDPSTRDEGIAELEGYRESWIYGLNKEQKAALDIAINNAKAGVTDPDKLLQQFEAVKPKPLEERAAYKAGAAIEKTVEEGLKRTPGYEEGKVGFALDIASAIGSTAGSVAQGLVLGTPGVLSASALQGIDEQLTRAKEAGLEGEEAAKFAVQGAGPGALGTLSTEYILRKIPPHARKALLKHGADILKSGVGEGVVEAVQQMAQNAIEQQYNKDRGIFDGTIYEGVLGGAAGMSVRAAVLAATRGRGVGGRTSEPPALQDVQKELAAEELKLREEESARKGSEKPGDEAKTPAKTPAEAADQGATKVEGKPVTVTLPGQDPWHGTETERFPDGGRRVVDREGVASTFYPDDDGVIEEGWKRITTEADAENTLKDWLSLEGQWQKVTVETTDGKIFRGIEGPADPGGGRIFRDGSGNLHGFASDAIREVEPGWEPGTPWTPDPVVGERAKEQSSAPSVTPEDQASPIQTEHIARGREVMADAVGTGKANTALEKAGLPNVGTYISLQDDNGDTIDGTINDATDGHVEILTRDGELITKSFEQAMPSLTVLPDFIRDRTEGRVEESDNTRERQQGGLGVQRRQGAGDQAEYGQGQAGPIQARVRDTEVQREAEEGQVVGAETQRQEAQATRERPEAEGVRGGERQEAIAQETKVKEDALKSWWDNADGTNRRSVLKRSGYSTDGMTNRGAQVYAGIEWSKLPQLVREKIVGSNPEIVAPSEIEAATSKPTAPEPTPADQADRVVARGTARTPRGTKVPVTYKVVEADDLITSQDMAGRVNPDYPQELQPRDRSRVMSSQQIDAISRRIYPEWLDQSPKTDDGAPIIGGDNVVESGNGRVLALKKAYDSGTADEYRAYLEERGYPVEGMMRPVLVRVREGETSPEQRMRFARGSNVDTKLRLSATEQAFIDIESMPEGMLDQYKGGEISNVRNRAFVRDFISRVVPAEDRGELFGSKGDLNQAGLRRVEAAILAKAYGDTALVESLVEATDSQILSISKAIQSVAPQWAKMRAAAADGRINPDVDQTSKLIDAVNLVRRARTDNRNVAEFVEQRDLLTGEAIDPVTEGFLSLMFRDNRQWTKPVSAERMGEAFGSYVEEAMKTKPGSNMFGDPARSPREIQDAIKQQQEKRYGKDQEVLFGQRKEPQGRSEEERSGSRGDVEDKGSPDADRGLGASDNAAQSDKREVTQDLAARAAKRRKELNIPEGVTVSDSGEPFAKAIFAQRAWKKRPKEEGPFEAEKVTGGWGYRRIGKARSEVKKVVSKIRKEPEARQEPTPDRVEKPAKPTKIESAEEAPKKKATTKKYDEKRNAVNAALREGLDRRGLTDIEVSTPDAISDIEGKKAIDDSTVAVGRTTGNLIEVALQGDHNYWQVMSHETIHVMKRLGLFKPVEWQALVNKAKADKRALADVRDRYAGESLTEDAIIEEVIAEQFGDYSAGINQPTGIFAKIYQKIKDFLSALDSALRGNGFMSASDVYAGIESGEIGSRPRDTEAQRERSETLIGQALGQLKDSSGGKALETKFARVSRGDFQFTHDMGLLRFWTISPRTVAAFSRSFARVYTAAKKQFATRDKTISELGKEYTEYRELSSSRKEKVNKVLELGRLTQRVFQASQNGTITVTAAQDTGLMKAGETVTLDAGEVAAYRSVRSMMDLAMDKYRDQIVRDFGLDPAVVNTPAQVMALVVPGTPRGQAKKLRTLAALLNDIRQAKRTGYIPFSRFGNMVVVAEQVDPATGQKTTLHSEVFEVKGVRGAWKRYRGLPEIAAKERELEQKYPGADIRTFQVASNEDNRKIGERDVLAELTQLQGPDLENKVQELFAEAQSKGFRKHFLGAKNIPGYSTDIEKAIADYVMSFSGFFARRQHHADWENAIKQIPKNKPRELRYANDYRDYVNNPQEEFAALRQTGFIMFLAGNFSNAVANLTQVPLISGPYLSLFSNPARVEFELARAYKDVALMFGNGKEIFNPNKAPRDVRNALKQAWDEGEFVPLAMHDIVGVAYNTKSSSSKISEAARGFVDGMAIPQTLSERANRLVTFIAAYRIAKRDPNFESKAKDILRDQQLAQEVLFTPTALGTDFALQYAKFIVDETQYDAGKINRAKIMRKMGAAFLQFKPFILNTLELHYKTAVLHKKGFSTWAMMMFALLGAGGLRGLPASDDAMWALELFWKWWSGIDEDLKANIRKDVDEFTGSPFAAEMVLHGPVRALGIDMSDRIGMGKIVPRTMEEAGGIPVSLAWGRGLEFLGAYRDDRAAGMAMALMPLIARNIAQSWLWRKEGVRTQRGDPVMGQEEISDLDAAVKSLGFNPRTVAERREMEWAQARAGKATQEAKSRYYRKLAKLKIEAAEAANAGDDEKFKELIDKYQETISEIQAHNDKVLEKKRYHQLIIIDKKALKRKMQEEIVGRGPVREKYVPKVARPRQQELREIYGATP
jgi:hypothetical protein